MTKLSHILVLAFLALAACKSAPESSPGPLPSSQPAPAVETKEATPAPAAQVRVYDETTTRIEAHVGERFELALPANVTTPFKWNLAPESLADVATLSAQTYTDAPPAGCERCVGYPGTAHFALDAAQEGETTLKLSYRGLGANGEVKRELAIALRVTP